MTSAAKKDNDEGNEAFADELAPGTSLLNGSYTIERFLNSGGFGITYLAKDSLDRSVVIKECFPGSFCRRSNTVVGARSRAHQAEFKSIVKLFVQEARSLSKLKHPNIVGVHQVFEDNDTAYMALDFVDGSDLLDIMESGETRPGPVEIQPILRKLLDAVAFIHDQGVLHRDISPDNILITDVDNPVLIDFGAAREEATKASRVLSALRVVKDGYSPQEFYIQGSDQSPSSDLYALGASFFHLIDGETPPNSQNRLAAIAAGESDPYTPLAGRVDGYEAGFLEAIDKALNVFPKDRLQSANEWLAFIDGESSEAIETAVAAVVTLPQKDEQQTAKVAGEVTPAAKVDAVAEPQQQKSKMGLLLGSAAAVAIIAALGAWQLSGGSEETLPSQDQQSGSVQTPVVENEPSETAATDTPADDATSTDDASATPNTEVVEDATAQDTTPTPTPTPTPRPTTTIEEPQSDVVEDNTPVAPTPDPVSTDVQTDVASADTPQTDDAPQTDVEPAPQDAQDTAAVETPPAPEPEPAPEPVFDTTPPTITSLISRPTQRPASNTGADLAVSTPAAEADVEVDKASDLPVLATSESSQQLSSIDTTPAILTPIPFFEEQPEVMELSAVMSRWSVDVPVSGEVLDTTIVDGPTAQSVDWLDQGQIVTEVNGLRIKSLDQIAKVVKSENEFGEAASVNAVIGYRDSEGGEDLEKTVELKTVHEVALLNGISFQSKFLEDAWVTTVLTAKDENALGLVPGDVLLSYISTSTTIDGPTTIREVIREELLNGTNSFNFAVKRDGSTWLASMNYDAKISN